MAELNPDIIAKADLAEEVVYSLEDATVARFVFDQGVLHLQSLQTNSHALDSRATQVATLLFAAAALAIASLNSQLSLSNGAAIVSALLFIWGGVTIFRVLRSDDIRLPGTDPAWWQGTLKEASFTEKEAIAWAARLQQIAIETTCRENDQRAEALNRGLKLGVAGAVLVGLSVVSSVWPELQTTLLELLGQIRADRA